MRLKNNNCTLAASKLDADEHFMVFKQYPDEETFALFGAVSSTLDISLEKVLTVLGGYFLIYCRQHGYDKMLTTLGGDLITFIQNLDSLHSLLSVSYVGITAPSFRCVEDEDGSLILHYYSARTGLYPIVIGLIEAVGKDLFHQKAKLTLLSQGQDEVGDSKSLYHAVLKVEVSDIPGETVAVQWAFGDAASYKHWTQMKARRPSFGADTGDRGTESFVRSEDFSTVFPYHILMDRRLLIRQCGENVRRLSMVAIKDGTPLQDVGTIVQPVIRQTAESIMTFINSVFIVAIHRKPGDQPFLLKGQMVWLTYARLLLFVGSPRLMSLDDFKSMKVFLSDVPIYDVTRELVLLNQQRIAEIDVARKLDETTMALKKTSKALEIEKRKTEELLHEMMPKKIAKQLTSGHKVKAERYESCTVLFSDIVTFTDIAADCPADDIVNMLNDLYHRFDTHTDSYDVYKVETIGDAYMAVTGVPEIQDDHAERMADFAMDMMEEAGNVLSPATGKPLKIRVGMHTGSVVAGVIGKKKPRYDIYGDTVNAASRMESNSVPGRIHVSKATFSKLYPYGYKFLARGHIQYGQIHCAVKELVQEKFGEEAWSAILEASELTDHEHFLAHTYYPDATTFRLLEAISQEIKMPVADVLHVFGGFFLTYCLSHGYDQTLRALGGDIISFIENLDSMHSLLALTYTDLKRPSFRCEKGRHGAFTLHYYSSREGLYPFVIGLLEAIGKELFNQNVTLNVVHQHKEETASPPQYHTVFHLELSSVVGRQNVSMKSEPFFTPHGKWTTDVDASASSVLKAVDFCSAFPYHMVFDKDMCIRQCGNNIRRLSQITITEGMDFNLIGDIVEPVINQTVDTILKYINAVYTIAIHSKPRGREIPLMLKGQMMWMEHSHVLLFVGSPRLTTLDQLIEMGVFLADIPLYDCTREVIFLNQLRIAESGVARQLDKMTAELKETSKALEKEKLKTEELLYDMLPEKVARQLTQGVAVKAEKFDCVTILFSDIVAFTEIASACSPLDIVDMLNELFHRFDTRTNTHDVYKVETVGDAYMGVAGAPEVQEDHAQRIADFALDILMEAEGVISPANGLPLQIRVGLHSGTVVAGVVGKKMPRYCLFGDTVNTASRMESNGVPGRIQLSEITYRKLYDYGYVFKRRGQIEVKGKGCMTTFFLVGHNSRHTKQPQDQFTNLPDEVCHSPITTIGKIRSRAKKTRKSFLFFRRSLSRSSMNTIVPPIWLRPDESDTSDSVDFPDDTRSHFMFAIQDETNGQQGSNWCVLV